MLLKNMVLLLIHVTMIIRYQETEPNLSHDKNVSTVATERCSVTSKMEEVSAFVSDDRCWLISYDFQ